MECSGNSHYQIHRMAALDLTQGCGESLLMLLFKSFTSCSCSGLRDHALGHTKGIGMATVHVSGIWDARRCVCFWGG